MNEGRGGSNTRRLTVAELTLLDSQLDRATYDVRRLLVKMRGVLEIERVQAVPETFLTEYRERLRALQTIVADLEQVGSEVQSGSPTVGEPEKEGRQLV